MSDHASRVYWLSFCDSDQPVGQQFLGVAIVDVTAAEVAIVLPDVLEKFPNEWIAAATRKAWQMGCNPGGDILSVDITDVADQADMPRNRLLSRVELEAWGEMIDTRT
jgi:hypothetical protein